MVYLSLALIHFVSVSSSPLWCCHGGAGVAGDAAHAWAHCCSSRAMVDVWRLFSGPRTSEGEADVDKVETISGNADVNADSSGAGSMDPPTLVTPPSSDDEDGGGRRLDSPPPHPPTPFRELRNLCVIAFVSHPSRMPHCGVVGLRG